jgi:clan AA aspartic protease
MITGNVTRDREAIISLVVYGSQELSTEIQAVIDTGFNDFLTLPPAIVTRLNLAYAATTQAILANGNVVTMNYHTATVLWDYELRDILVLSAEGGPLVGMSLLYGYDFFMEAVDGGMVNITRRGAQ